MPKILEFFYRTELIPFQNMFLKQIGDTCEELKYNMLYVNIFGDLNV